VREEKEPAMQLDEDKVEDAFVKFRAAVNFAVNQELPNLEALIERIRVELMIQTMRRERRDVYRALIDLLEDEVDEQYEKIDEERGSIRHQVESYVRRMIRNLTQADD
jgi:DNA-directed RNA polymerase specialized sigma24 family protein